MPLMRAPLPPAQLPELPAPNSITLGTGFRHAGVGEAHSVCDHLTEMSLGFLKKINPV